MTYDELKAAKGSGATVYFADLKYGAKRVVAATVTRVALRQRGKPEHGCEAGLRGHQLYGGMEADSLIFASPDDARAKVRDVLAARVESLRNETARAEAALANWDAGHGQAVVTG